MAETARLQRIGNSTGVTLRKELLTAAGFKRGDEVSLHAGAGEIRILRAQGRYSRSLANGEAIAIRYARVFAVLLR